MSKAHYFVRGFTKQQIMDLICYETRYPSKLTSTQKITRMYMSLLRIGHTQYFIQFNQRLKIFERQAARWRVEFQDLLQNDRDYEALNRGLQRYEEWHWKNLDPNMIIKENRPYSMTSGRFAVYDDEALSYDPFGYYIEKSSMEGENSYSFPLLADYPVEEYFVRTSDECVDPSYVEPMEDHTIQQQYEDK